MSLLKLIVFIVLLIYDLGLMQIKIWRNPNYYFIWDLIMAGSRSWLKL